MKIMNKDKEVFESICRTGHVRREQINSLNVNDNRIKTYLKEGYITKEYTRGQECFKLTKEGHKLAENEMGIENHYKPQSPNHDLGIADKYFSLSYRERDTFKTEKELQKEFKEYIERLREIEPKRAEELERKTQEEKISTPDCSFVSGGKLIAFEVITINYNKQIIQSKQEFCKEMDMQYQQVRR